MTRAARLLTPGPTSDPISSHVSRPGVPPCDAFIRVQKQEPVYPHASFMKLRNYRKICEDRQAIVSGHELLQHLVVPHRILQWRYVR